MTLSIKNVQTDRLARELARATGESITDAVTEAIRQRLSSVTGRRHGIAGQLGQIAEQGRNLPRLDDRAESEILG
ncbi:MAG: type II toxin-antitoxin system VapB family antitoxin [Actinobacteria bacterium]|nr:type II toxin-antitoxin system VapB family antitoxin [Actinomycetota bacterium]